MADLSKMSCYKCRKYGHGMKERPNYVCCDICWKESHLTTFCDWPKQTKPVAKLVGYVADGLGCLVIQNTKAVNTREHVNPMALITIKNEVTTDRQLEQGFMNNFNWK